MSAKDVGSVVVGEELAVASFDSVAGSAAARKLDKGIFGFIEWSSLSPVCLTSSAIRFSSLCSQK